MDRDIKLALLGDHEAAKRLTDAGALLPCPVCGSNDIRIKRVREEFTKEPLTIRDAWQVYCSDWCAQTKVYVSEIFQNDDGKLVIVHDGAYEARLAWNTRAPILNAEEMEMLHGKST